MARIEVPVRRELEGTEEYVVLAVRDHGIGIPAEDLGRVFERFQRASNVPGRIAGTGIGLASARSTMEATAVASAFRATRVRAARLLSASRSGPKCWIWKPGQTRLPRTRHESRHK